MVFKSFGDYKLKKHYLVYLFVIIFFVACGKVSNETGANLKKEQNTSTSLKKDEIYLRLGNVYPVKVNLETIDASRNIKKEISVLINNREKREYNIVTKSNNVDFSFSTKTPLFRVLHDAKNILYTIEMSNTSIDVFYMYTFKNSHKSDETVYSPTANSFNSLKSYLLKLSYVKTTADIDYIEQKIKGLFHNRNEFIKDYVFKLKMLKIPQGRDMYLYKRIPIPGTLEQFLSQYCILFFQENFFELEIFLKKYVAKWLTDVFRRYLLRYSNPILGSSE